MSKFTKKKKVLAVTAAVVLTGGAAFAYWTQNGAGSGEATTGTSVAVVVNQTNAVTGLFPGGPAQALSGDFDNPGSSSVSLGAVTASVTETSETGCLPAWYSITGTGTPATQVITSGDDVGAWSGLNVSMLDDAANQDVCKDATITITYAVAAGA